MDRTVIIPTAKMLRYVEPTLQSLATLADRPEEVIVVQNGLPTEVQQQDLARYQTLATHFPNLNLKLFYDEVPGLLSGRHRGLQEASGDLLIFVDDDVTFTPNWLAAFTDAFTDPQTAVAGGPSSPAFAIEPPDWLLEHWQPTPCGGRLMIQLSLLQLNTQAPVSIDFDLIWGLNYAIRREAILEYGGFHPDCVPPALQHFQGDGETGLGRKISQAGKRAVYCPEAGVLHHIAAGRMRPEYFEQRAFYQGVCDSYTHIRRSTTPKTMIAEATEATSPTLLELARRWKRMLIPPRKRNSLQPRFERAYRRGIKFHSLCVQSSPRLLKWVRQETYFNYTYPTLEPDFNPPLRRVHEASESRKTLRGSKP